MECFLDKDRKCDGHCVASRGSIETIPACAILDTVNALKTFLAAKTKSRTVYPPSKPPPEVKF